MAGKTGVIWNPFSPGYFENPYDHLTACREENPIQIGAHGAWMFFNYHQIQEILRSNEFEVSDLSAYFSMKEPYIFQRSDSCPYLSAATKQWPMYLNGDHHKKIRSAMGKALSSLPLEDIITNSVNKVNKAFKDKVAFDLVEYCAVFVLEVVKGLFNISNYRTIDEIRKYSNLLARSQDLFVPRQVYQEVNQQLLWGKKLFHDSPYKTTLFEALASENLSPDDHYSLMAISLMAAFETSKDNLGLSLYEIIQSNELMAISKSSDPNARNLLIEELLRYSCPLQYTIRVNKQSLHIGDITIPERSKLFLCLASANRDPEVFEQPNKIIANRNPNPHLSFGGGLHFCLGATTARLEMRHCLIPMIKFLAAFKVIRKPIWSKQIFMRTAKSIPLEKIR